MGKRKKRVQERRDNKGSREPEVAKRGEGKAEK